MSSLYGASVIFTKSTESADIVHRMGEFRRYHLILTAVLIAFFFGTVVGLQAQPENAEGISDDIFDNGLPTVPGAAEQPDLVTEVLDLPGALPRGFGRIEFGMTREQVGELLIEDPNFNYRGEPDVQFLPRQEEVVIDTAGFDFVSRGYFQFHEGSLYSIIINLDTRQVDYFSMFDRLRNQYGHPDSLNPSGALWEDGEVRLALERPLSVKYLDLSVFEALRDERSARESDRARALRNFLEQF